MAFKLSKAEHTTREDLINRLREAQEAFEAAKDAGEGIPDRLAEFIVVLGEAETFRDEIASRWREEFDEKSDNWQQGDRGSEVDSLVSDWEEADFSEPPLEDPAELDLEDYAQILEDLGTEPE